MTDTFVPACYKRARYFKTKLDHPSLYAVVRHRSNKNVASYYSYDCVDKTWKHLYPMNAKDVDNAAEHHRFIRQPAPEVPLVLAIAR